MKSLVVTAWSTKSFAAVAIAAVSLVVGCASQATEEPVAKNETALTMRHRCDVAGLTEVEIKECIAWVTDQTPDPTYCADPNGYDCENFTNTYCDGAANYNIGCAGLVVGCGGNIGNDYVDKGHAVSVVFFPGVGCMVVEPQNGNTIAGPYPAVDGSCNTFTEAVADKVCHSVHLGDASCATYYDGAIPEGSIHCDQTYPYATAPAPAPLGN